MSKRPYVHKPPKQGSRQGRTLRNGHTGENESRRRFEADMQASARAQRDSGEVVVVTVPEWSPPTSDEWGQPVFVSREELERRYPKPVLG